ncbi:MAG: hypothetical protein RIS54_1399 [Verrucomicrobiota bacterium]|jgi:predicted secreted acid phosphatase
MKMPRVLVLLALSCLLIIPLRALEPPNLSVAKQAVIRYADTGDYERDIAEVVGYARDWLEARVARRAEGEKLALVLDIDETALSNLKHMREMDFGYVPEHWDAWVANDIAPAFAPVLQLFQWAREHDVAGFFITGRREKDRPGTERNLRAVGYGDHAGLFLKPDTSTAPTQTFKTEQRQKLEAAGWTIIANLGDQRSDLAGGASERVYKLPNPYYLIK